MARLKVEGDGVVTAGKIVCLLRNYRAHAAEMSSAPPKEPYFFLKPSTSIIHDGGTIVIPRMSRSVHHEVELAVVVGRLASHVPRERAMEHVLGYAVMIDVTARDIQDEAKRDGRPWAAAKVSKPFAPLSSVVPKERVADPHGLELWLKVNGEVRQKGRTSQMIFDIPTVIEYVSSIMALEPGDVIATGTPEGVGPLAAGDVVEACVQSVGSVKVSVADAAWTGSTR